VFSDNNPLRKKIRYYIGFIMALLYIAIGSLFLFTDIAIETFPAYRVPVGVVLLVYAAFRLYSTIKTGKESDSVD
jgi:hypothetical protein